MKRRNLVIVFLLVAALTLGIGYAAATDVLDINGNADVNPDQAFNEDIYFSAAVANDAGNVAYVSDDDKDVASFSVNSLSGKGDSATFTFTIKNDGDLNVTVTPTLAADGNSQPDYFDISSDWAGQAKDLAAGGEITYTVTVALKATPPENLHATFHIELTATPKTAE